MELWITPQVSVDSGVGNKQFWTAKSPRRPQCCGKNAKPAKQRAGKGDVKMFLVLMQEAE